MERSKHFDTLYALSSTGKQKEWTISVVENKDFTATITIVHGYTDGKKQTNTRLVARGKNLGRSNETSPYDQAISEAESKYNKKIDEGYDPQLQHAKEDSIMGVPRSALLPMLALDYTKRAHDIIFPCMVQPKVDGVRALFIDGKFISRKNKEFIHLEHIKQELGPTRLILDGELYSDTLAFQDISGIVRKVKLTPSDREKLLQVKYVVFDHISEETFQKRYQALENFFKGRKLHHCELLETHVCTSKEFVIHHLAEFEQRGFEGLILRNTKGYYHPKYRSKHLQKLKTFQDMEFKIIGYRQGEGLEEGCVIWECATPMGHTFSVRPIGTRESRMTMYENGERYIGKNLTVKFQETLVDDVPRFPVGIAIRDYE